MLSRVHPLVPDVKVKLNTIELSWLIVNSIFLELRFNLYNPLRVILFIFFRMEKTNTMQNISSYFSNNLNDAHNTYWWLSAETSTMDWQMLPCLLLDFTCNNFNHPWQFNWDFQSARTYWGHFHSPVDT